MVILTESRPTSIFTEDKKELFTEDEKKFILSKNLIKVRNDEFIPLFVGELITPENTYFSVPKNFEPIKENIELFKKILDRYKTVTDDKNKTIIFNNSFIVSKTGDIKSERFYFNELKEFFLDFITYEFIYPEKSIKKHSGSPIKNSKIDVLSTIRNRKQKGPGITYKVKDVKNSEKWNIDDIYWTTIKNLSDSFGTESEKLEIQEMYEFLIEEGYKIKKIDVSNIEETLYDIEKCKTHIIHNPIKNTLLSYYKSKSVDLSFTINAFLTKNFEYVWENLIRDGLKHNETEFGVSVDKFKKTEIVEDWFPTGKKSEVDDIIKNKSGKITRTDRTGFYVEYELKDLGPDLFSYYKGKRFIGDAKYYKEPDNADFDKEFSTYNTIQGNKYPMVILLPGKRTFIPQGFGYRRGRGEVDERELIVFFIDIKSLFEDCINKTDNVINRVHQLISKRTRREF